jgi:hypothetical protein
MSEIIIFSDDELEKLRNGKSLADAKESNGDDFLPEDEEPQSPDI